MAACSSFLCLVFVIIIVGFNSDLICKYTILWREERRKV